jgi:RNA polymerase sigma factor (sigma-70 family)
MTGEPSGNINCLWNEFLKGDDKAFSLIYYQQIKRLLTYGYKLSPEKELVHDAIQEVFLDLYQKKGKPHILIEDLKGYLFISLKHSILKKVAGLRKFDLGRMDERYSDYFKVEYNFQDEIIKKETGEETRLKILHAVEQLSPREKEIIYLKFEEELDYAQISKILEITIESCHKQFYRAMKELRKLCDPEKFLNFFLLIAKKS